MTVSQVILSGIRATGRLHFGNYLGAVQNFVRYQIPGNTCMYFIADLHTLTTLTDPEELRQNLREIVKDYLAAGLDPEQSILYAQSSIPEIPELSWYLSTLQSLGELLNMPTYKEKVRANPNLTTLGLVSYPVLMAADILGPKANLVPVGEDQASHVALTRNLAQKFNRRFGKTFVVPKLMSQMLRVPGLDGQKMGKSDADNSIPITMRIPEIRQRYLERGITDPERKRREDPGDPYNRCKSVYAVHELVTAGETDTRAIAKSCMAAQIGCVECKNLLVDSIAKMLEPFQERRRELADKDQYVDEVLHEGGKRARAIIAPTVAVVREKMGIVQY